MSNKEDKMAALITLMVGLFVVGFLLGIWLGKDIGKGFVQNDVIKAGLGEIYIDPVGTREFRITGCKRAHGEVDDE